MSARSFGWSPHSVCLLLNIVSKVYFKSGENVRIPSFPLPLPLAFGATEGPWSCHSGWTFITAMPVG